MLKSQYLAQIQKLIINSFDPMMRDHIYYFSKKKANCIQWSCSPASSFWMGEAAELDVSQAKTILYYFLNSFLVFRFDGQNQQSHPDWEKKHKFKYSNQKKSLSSPMLCCCFASKWETYSCSESFWLYCIWICVRHNCTRL